MISNLEENSLSFIKNVLLPRLKQFENKVKQLEGEVSTLKVENILLRKENSLLRNENKILKSEVLDLAQKLNSKNIRKDSSNSSMPPSSDFSTPQRNQSLRKKSDKPSGGQIGHKGSTLTKSKTVDFVKNYNPTPECSCGCKLDMSSKVEHAERQEFDIPKITAMQVTAHKTYSVVCKCGKKNIGKFPAHIKSSTQYGTNTKTTIAYLSVQQYVPYSRLTELVNTFFGQQISQGTVRNILESTSKKLSPIYEKINDMISNCFCVGGDETGYKYNSGEKGWFWVWRSKYLTYIAAKKSRGHKSVIEEFPDGFQNTIFVSDSLAAQLKTPTKGKQICLVHILRNLNYIIQTTDGVWGEMVKKIFIESFDINNNTNENAFPVNNKIGFQNRLKILLTDESHDKNEDIRKLRGRLIKSWNWIFTFLDYYEVPFHNNESEQSIRNAKVKQKISGGFRSDYGAQHFALIRSIIDTTIKNKKDIFETLRKAIAPSESQVEDFFCTNAI